MTRARANARLKRFQPPKKQLIDGVVVKQLKMICDERGMLMEIFRSDDPQFRKFGQVYLTTAYPGVIKAWHYHKVQWDNFCCIKGQIKLVLWDDRKNSKTRGVVNEFFLSPRNPIVVTIPPLVYHGFKGTGTEESFVLNVPTEPYRHDNPDEFRAAYDDPSIPYDWSLEHG